MKRIALACCLLLAASAAAQAADVINGCYLRNNGQFRILLAGDACGPSEVTVSFRSATDSGGLNPEIFDANGQFLGVGQAGDLYIPSLRKWATIRLTDASGDIWSGQLYYQSADCTGQPYADYEYLHRVFGVGQQDVRKHYTAAPELSDYIPIRSLDDGYGNCETLDFDYQTVLSKAVEVTLPFTTPVALPTKIVAPKTGLAGRIRR